MSLYCAVGSAESDLSSQRLKDLLAESLSKLGERNRVLAVPPTNREHSRAGELTRYAWKHYGDRLKAILPALGTHVAMRPEQISHMFGDVPRNSSASITGAPTSRHLASPAKFVREQSEGKLNYAWPAQVNKLLARGGFDLILSIGQSCP